MLRKIWNAMYYGAFHMRGPKMQTYEDTVK